MPKFRVELSRGVTVLQSAEMVVEAADESGAESKAERILFKGDNLPDYLFRITNSGGIESGGREAEDWAADKVTPYADVAPALIAADARRAGLTLEYQLFCKSVGLPSMSADELIGEEVSAPHRAYLADFVERWDAMEAAADTAQRGA